MASTAPPRMPVTASPAAPPIGRRPFIAQPPVADAPAAPLVTAGQPTLPTPPTAPVHRSARRRTAALADLSAGAAVATLVFVVALWLANGGIQTISEPGGLALTTGRLTGLLASDLLLIQVLLMARIPFVERAWGQDLLARRHRLVGETSFYLMMAHVVLIVIGYTQSGSMGLLGQTWDLVVNYPGMLLAVAGTAALLAVVATSLRAARRRMRYESWHLLHLYAYVGVGLALPHQLWTGADFLASPAATVFWWTLWALAAAAIVTFRLGVPLARSLFHAIAVESVVPEASGIVSVIMRGRRLDRLPVRPGQYLHWRFLSGPGWMRAHPYSVSGLPAGDHIRITARIDGDDGARLGRLRPGTRVLIEGPYGGLTPERRRRRDVLLIAAGVGITPMRALAERIAMEPASPGPGGLGRPSVVLLHRVSTASDAVFGGELAALSLRSGVRVVRLVGPRSADGSWLPAGPRPADGGQVLRQLVPDVAGREVYLCGPPAWMASVAATARRLGIPAAAIHREDFSW